MGPSTLRRVLVVGGSIAGVSAADTLRAEGFEGTITVVGEEPHTAYARPPLSKTALLGDDAPGSVLLPPLDGVEVLTGARATTLDIAGRRVSVEVGGAVELLEYDGLVLATGARARRLAGPGTSGEHVVRSLDDALGLGRSLRSARRVVVLGGGFLGMELASTVRGLGLEVTVVDVVAPLVRQLGPVLASLVAEAARDNGVELRTSPGGAWLHGEREVGGVRLADGTVLEADVVVSAVGDLPNSEWLAGSGLVSTGCLPAGPGGVVTTGIVAAGDLVSCCDAVTGAVTRTPHWHSAIAQGRAAARTLLGLPLGERVDVPYFWTEGHGLEIKIAGAIPLDAPAEVIEGSLSERTAVLQWQVHGRPVAAATVNHRMPLVKLKRLATDTRSPSSGSTRPARPAEASA